MLRIARLHAIEILDSRARPTLAVTLETDSGLRLRAGVPAGVSTGAREAVELRDGDPERYDGQGVRRAVAHVNGEIAQALTGQRFSSLEELDATLIDLDGTPDKHRLGANALLGVSLVAARTEAAQYDRALWQQLAALSGAPALLPVPHFTVVGGGGGGHGGGRFREFMVAPLGAACLADAVRAGAEIHARLGARLIAAADAAGRPPVGLGDEGGFAPAMERPEDVLRELVGAITDAGYSPGRDGVAIALDPAASDLRTADGRYLVAGDELTSDQLIDRYEEIVDRFPVWSVEDGLGEDDWDGWERLTARLGGRVQLMGDDLFATHPALIAEAIGRNVANSALIKVNQIGTVTETMTAIGVCRGAGYRQMVSHRSGETDDSFIADLAVGAGCGQLKSGGPARGEHVAKYNRLLEIADSRPELPFGLSVPVEGS
ncbi:phosphopyruvate hydratase [Streptomyces paludis]|uniref:Enolase n=1 Tax=Streptomyces paludis TaxID=2282738 RepID=A0A345HLA0_9ACTN|nr:enolase [Streptomyces paludis]AXG77474.1 phosphopyruvate hydratase [Streptomyces paludis]